MVAAAAMAAAMAAVAAAEVGAPGVDASKQEQPLSKARPEFKSPAQFLLLPLDGVRRWPSLSTPVASLHDRWCVFFPCNNRTSTRV